MPATFLALRAGATTGSMPVARKAAAPRPRNFLRGSIGFSGPWSGRGAKGAFISGLYSPTGRPDQEIASLENLTKTMHAPVHWPEEQRAKLVGQKIALHVKMRQARLYSYCFK